MNNGMGSGFPTLLVSGRRRGGLSCPNQFAVGSSFVLSQFLGSPRGGEHQKEGSDMLSRGWS